MNESKSSFRLADELNYDSLRFIVFEISGCRESRRIKIKITRAKETILCVLFSGGSTVFTLSYASRETI